MATQDNKSDAWNQDVLACRNVYTLLIGLKQLTEPFTPAGKKSMKQLAFWSPAASETMRQLIATGLATQLDKFYMKVLLAGYEEGYDFHDAIETMRKDLTAPDKTVADLAVTVNEVYRFRGE